MFKKVVLQVIIKIKDMVLSFDKLTEDDKRKLSKCDVDEILLPSKEGFGSMTANFVKSMQKTIDDERFEERSEIALNLLDVLDDETISKKTGLDIKFVKKLREENTKK